MENASKALAIAGGVLLAVLILSVMIYAYSHIQSVERSKAEVLKAEELAKFNREFETYNKKDMYGTDVVSAINKAISYNDKYETNLITISMEITEDDMCTIKYTHTFVTDKSNVSYGKWITSNSEKLSDYASLEKKEYSTDRDETLIKRVLSQSDKWNERTYTSEDKREYTTTTTTFSLIKRSNFTCTGVDYDSVTGRISSMSFKQTSKVRGE